MQGGQPVGPGVQGRPQSCARLDPKRPELELDGIERASADTRVALVLLERLEASRLERQYLERWPQRIDEPGMGDAFTCVDAQLLAPVDRFRGRRQNLANPVRRKRQIRGRGPSPWHASH